MLVNDHDFRSTADGIAVPYGVKVTDAAMQALAIKKDDALPKWNYEIRLN